MNPSENIHLKRDFYGHYLAFIESEADVNDCCSELIKYLDSKKVSEDPSVLKEFLQMIIKITNNHYRNRGFFQKVNTIILHFQEKIKQYFTNPEIFQIFESNKRILLLLFKAQILTVDDWIVTFLLDNRRKPNYRTYCHFFMPEIEPFLDDQKRQLINYSFNFNFSTEDNFEEKRQEGENDSLIAKYIRNDMLHEFVTYVTINKYSHKIQESVYETNPFLLDKEPSLIEYAAFFGSLKIFNYLKPLMGLNSSLWPFVIHGGDVRMIHVLEEERVVPENNDYEPCLIEAIKCHHNNIANYIINLAMLSNDDELSFKYRNYYFLPDHCDHLSFIYSCQYGYWEMVKLYLNQGKKKNEGHYVFIYLFLIQQQFVLQHIMEMMILLIYYYIFVK